MLVIPASSKITVVPAGGEGRVGSVWRVRNPARVSVGQPASTASTSAAFPDGANPTTGRPDGLQLGDRGSGGGGLSGAGRADHHHQICGTGHRRDRGLGRVAA